MVAINVKEQETAEYHIRRLDKMKGDRGTLEAHLQEVSERVIPRKSHVTYRKVKGSKRDPEITDSTAVFANQNMASGLYGHLFSGRWFGLKARKKDINDSEDVQNWFMEVTRILLEELAVSNFNDEIFELLIDIGWCGTPCIGVDPGKETLLTFETFHINEYFIAEDNKGKIDTNYRKFKYTARQAVQEWGEKNLGKDVMEAYNSPKPENMDKEFWFLHVLFPRKEHDKSYPALSSRQPIASLWIDVKAKKVIKIDGYYEMPKFVTRWVKMSNELYGRSQGMFLLPEIKSANHDKKWLSKAISKAISPVILAPDDGFIGTVRTNENSIIYYRRSLQGKDKPEQWVSKARVDWAREELNETRRIIKVGFFNDLFVMLGELKGKMTAFEIAERIEEKHSLIIAPVGRLQSSLCNGMIRRCINILGRARRLPPVPRELAGQEYEIEYISKLALALKIIEVRALSQGMNIIEPFLEGKPDMMDNYDTDEIARGVAERLGWPVEWIRDIDLRDEMREDRLRAEQAVQAAELAAGAADAVPKLQKKTEEGSPLEALVGAT